MTLALCNPIHRWCLQPLRKILLPDRCALCGTKRVGGTVCKHCLRILPFIEYACERCATPLAATQSAGTGCGVCQRAPPVFSKAVAATHYRFPVDAALKTLKYDGRLFYAPAFATLLLPLLNEHFAGTDALVPVPLHRWRHARRGFNQATEICRVIARESGVPMLRVVWRIRATRSQSGLSAAARRRNLQNAFAVRKPLGCRQPLIIDDVMTTGETCNHIARVLIEAGAESVGVLVVARA